MVSNIDLNPASGKNDQVHVFTVVRLHSFSGAGPDFKNGLFGHDDGRWDKFVCFKPDKIMIISGVSGADNVEVTSSDWKTKANASELNKWNCLSFHWDVPAGNNKSSCWVNGKK